MLKASTSTFSDPQQSELSGGNQVLQLLLFVALRFPWLGSSQQCVFHSLSSLPSTFSILGLSPVSGSHSLGSYPLSGTVRYVWSFQPRGLCLLLAFPAQLALPVIKTTEALWQLRLQCKRKGGLPASSRVRWLLCRQAAMHGHKLSCPGEVFLPGQMDDCCGEVWTDSGWASAAAVGWVM